VQTYVVTRILREESDRMRLRRLTRQIASNPEEHRIETLTAMKLDIPSASGWLMLWIGNKHEK